MANRPQWKHRRPRHLSCNYYCSPRLWSCNPWSMCSPRYVVRLTLLSFRLGQRWQNLQQGLSHSGTPMYPRAAWMWFSLSREQWTELICGHYSVTASPARRKTMKPPCGVVPQLVVFHLHIRLQYCCSQIQFCSVGHESGAWVVTLHSRY